MTNRLGFNRDCDFIAGGNKQQQTTGNSISDGPKWQIALRTTDCLSGRAQKRYGKEETMIDAEATHNAL